MPRAHRHFIPGHVWHITHRCHKKEFLLKFGRDRSTYMHWLFEARKRFGLEVLNFVVTCNHIHLLVRDPGADVIAKSIQLVAGRTAQRTTNASSAKALSGKTAITPPRSRRMLTCIAVWCTSI